jgi:hypothetical protein
MAGAAAPERPFRRLVCACAALPLAACVEAGDFGRPKLSVWNDALATTGAVSAYVRGEPVSRFVLTDDERELRDRAWRFLTPAHERAVFDMVLADLTRTRILPAWLGPSGVTGYFAALMTGPVRSPASRYRRISDDAEADRKLIAPLAATALRVNAADDLRLRGLTYVRQLSRPDIVDAAARVAENRCLIAWVRFETARRLASYRYALEHLLIEAPQAEALPVERGLATLEAQRGVLDEVLRPSPACLSADQPAVAASIPAPSPLVTK